jgi:hypothetical protein
MLTDYSDLEKEIEEAPEPKYLPAGTEVKARIVQVGTGVSDKNNCEYYMPLFDVPDDPMVMMFNDFFWHLDKEKLDAKDYQQSLYKFQKFAASFGIDYSRPFDWEDDLPSKEGWMILGVAKDKTGQYPDKNNVKKYIAPK